MKKRERKTKMKMMKGEEKGGNEEKRENLKLF